MLLCLNIVALALGLIGALVLWKQSGDKFAPEQQCTSEDMIAHIEKENVKSNIKKNIGIVAIILSVILQAFSEVLQAAPEAMGLLVH